MIRQCIAFYDLLLLYSTPIPPPLIWYSWAFFSFHSAIDIDINKDSNNDSKCYETHSKGHRYNSIMSKEYPTIPYQGRGDGG